MLVERCSKRRTYNLHHTKEYKKVYVWYVLFIVSETMLFLAFFWAFFMLVSTYNKYRVYWPPMAIDVFLLFKSIIKYLSSFNIGATLT